MKGKNKIAIFWFRRDFRLNDNTGLHRALQSGYPVLPIFIFDTEILDELPKDDHRVSFIYDCLESINSQLAEKGSSLICSKGKVLNVWKQILNEYNVAAVYTNKDYEPYARKRDSAIKSFLNSLGIPFYSLKDQVIFEENEIVKKDSSPYTVYTPFKNQWLKKFKPVKPIVADTNNFLKIIQGFPKLETFGFKVSELKVKPFQLLGLIFYENLRNFPFKEGTSNLSPHLRFGTIGIRSIISKMYKHSTFLNELIWREFFMQILFHFPNVVSGNFKAKYDEIAWRNNEHDFECWKKGETGYAMVDAGMRELNETGYMHNRVRMVVAGFLCKHLLIDWRWGESYFAQKLFDYELSSNNGNWQWAAGTGCDAAPYFRVFNPTEQLKKFDPELEYIKKWIPEFETPRYPAPIVEHKFARERALKVYKAALIEKKV